MAEPSTVLKQQYGFFHANSKLLNREANLYTYNSNYKHGHVTILQDILAQEIPYCTTSTEVDTWMVNNPGVLKKYIQQPLSVLLGTSNEIWYIKDSTLNNQWMKPIILPELVPHPTTNLRSTGYLPTLFKEDGTQILPADGMWLFDPYQGAIKFGDGYNPADMSPSWGIPKITCYIYVGKTLDLYLSEIKPLTYRYLSTTPALVHDISHNLSSMDVSIEVKVQDPYSGLWTRDWVGITYGDENNISVHLTDESNVLVNVQLVRMTV